MMAEQPRHQQSAMVSGALSVDFWIHRHCFINYVCARARACVRVCVCVCVCVYKRLKNEMHTFF